MQICIVHKDHSFDSGGVCLLLNPCGIFGKWLHSHCVNTQPSTGPFCESWFFLGFLEYFPRIHATLCVASDVIGVSWKEWYLLEGGCPVRCPLLQSVREFSVYHYLRFAVLQKRSDDAYYLSCYKFCYTTYQRVKCAQFLPQIHIISNTKSISQYYKCKILSPIARLRTYS